MTEESLNEFMRHIAKMCDGFESFDVGRALMAVMSNVICSTPKYASLDEALEGAKLWEKVLRDQVIQDYPKIRAAMIYDPAPMEVTKN